MDEWVNGFDGALEKWRDSCMFFFKFDVALAAGIAALASYLKLEGVELLMEIAANKWLLLTLSSLVVYAIGFEWLLTSTRVRLRLSDHGGMTKSSLRKGGRVFAALFAIQVIGHLLLACSSIAYVMGASDAAAELVKRDCGPSGANPGHPFCPINRQE